MSDISEWEMLKLPRRGIVAIEAMIHIALLGAGRVVPTAELSETIDVPKRSLEPILLSLAKAGLLTSARGPQGGYELAKDRGKISVLSIIEAALGSGSLSEPERDSPYERVSAFLENAAEKDLRSTLALFSLAQLVDLARQKKSAPRQPGDYAI